MKTNATVVDDAIRFVSDMSKDKEEMIKLSSSNNNESDKEESTKLDYDNENKDQLEEEQDEEDEAGKK